MPLDPERIKQLLASKNKPKAKGGGRGKGKKVDTSIRNVTTWFALDHLMTKDDEILHCANPNCVDPREKGIMVVEVDNTFMCRYCFLEGWRAPDNNPAQESLDVAS